MNRLFFLIPALLTWLLPLFITSGSAHAQDSDPRLVIDPRGAAGMVKELIFTPDGKTLLSMGDDKAIRFWDVNTGELRKTLRLGIGDGSEGKIFCGALSPDGRWLAAGGFGLRGGPHNIRIVNLDSGRVSAVLSGHTNVIHSLDFSRDGRWLASGSGDDTVRVWDISALATKEGGDVLEINDSEELVGHSSNVYAVSFSPDANRIVSGSFDHTLILWKRYGGGSFEKAATMEGHTAEVRCGRFSLDRRYVLSGGYDNRLLKWDGETGAFLRELDGDMEYQVQAIAFCPDNRRAVVSSQGYDGYIGIFDFVSNTRLLRFDEQNSTTVNAAWHPTQELVATSGGYDNDTYIWRPDTGEVVHHIVGDGENVWSVAFAQNGLKIATGQTYAYQNHSHRGPLQETFDFQTMTLEQLPEAEGDPAGFVRAVRDQGGNTLKLVDDYRLETGSGAITSEAHGRGKIRCFTFTRSGNVAVAFDFSLRLFTPEGEEIREFVGHEGVVWAVSPSPDGRYLASSAMDQTSRLWNLETGDLLATLFVSRDGEWVCWTPSGHYHASAGGEKYIGWHINKGIDRVADYYPSYVFREQYHHPQLVKRSILLADFDKALAEVGDTRVQDLAEMLPPQIDWIFPQATRGGASGSSVTVRANITSPNAGLEEVKLLVNGKAVASDFRVSGNSLSYEQTIDLLPGENRLSLFARNARAGHTSDERVVTVRGAGPTQLSEIDKTNLDDLLKPNLYVLSVGVSEYEIDSIPSLEYCDDDATAIAEFFEKQADGIFGKTEVKLLKNETATELGVQEGLDWLADNATQQDFVVLFLAAHGVNDERGNFYLLPHDAHPDRLRSTGVAWDDFGDILGNLPSRVLMFLDTCHSGRLGANLFTLANVDGARSRSLGGLKSAFDPTEAIRELTSDENGVVIMAASTGDEESVEHDDWGHGAFTMGLLEGFKGKADVNNDGIVHLRELDFFVADHVKLLTGGRQHPTTVKPSTISRLPVARVK